MQKLADLFPDQLKASLGKVEFAFALKKKLPLSSKRQVLSAIKDFFNIKSVTQQEKDEAYKKIIQKSDVYRICTIAFSKRYESDLEGQATKK